MTITEIAEVWSAWAFIPILVALLSGVVHYKRLSKTQLWVFYLVLVSFVVQIVASIFWSIKWNNLPLLHFYTPVELCLLLGFYASLEREQKARKFLLVLSVLFVCAAVINVLFFQSIYEFNTWFRGAESLLLVFFSIRTFVKVMQELKIRRLTAAPVFWFNAAILIYFSVNFILFLFNNQLNRLPEATILLPWLVHALFMIIYYLLLTLGLWKKSKV